MALSFLFRALKNRFTSQPKAKVRRGYRPFAELLEDRTAPANITVTGTGDTVAVDGLVTLREAILSANNNANVNADVVGTVNPYGIADTIKFNIAGGGVKTINVLSALPTLTGPVTIDGSFQPGFSGVPLIELNGIGAGAGTNGLTMKAAGSVVRSLVINNFGGNGILVYGNNSVVEGCYIGTNSAGTGAAANKFHGVLIAGTATNVRIGGTTTAQRNVISGNVVSGVAIIGTLTTANKVQGNFIGTNAAGTVGLGNGVLISGGSKSNVIGGGAVAGTRNVIFGGVEISGVGTSGNAVQGNFIGLGQSGVTALGHVGDGVRVAAGATGNVIGGTALAARNLISNNSGSGVTLTDAGTSGNVVLGNFIGTGLTGTELSLGNGIGVLIAVGAKNNTIGGTVAGARNVINSSAIAGVHITGAGTTGNVLQGNIIGLSVAGLLKRSNQTGVEIAFGATGNVVGGAAAGARNVISGNGAAGVHLFGMGTAGNLVQGNFIGTGLTGVESGLGNGYGVVLSNTANNNTVGGIVGGTRNVISGNIASGVLLQGNGTAGNQIQGNFIGVNAAGTAALANSSIGIQINDAANNTIGGTVAAARNVISGNGNQGVYISSGAGNVLRGNFIGTNAAGTAAIPNNGGVQVIGDALNTVIGGAIAGAGNVISGNFDTGLFLTSIGASNITVQGNIIGLNATGTAALPNTGNGVQVANGMSAVTIGGVGALARNVISANGLAGVVIRDTDAANCKVQGNFIGTLANGITPAGNTLHGVVIVNTAHDNLIGGTVAGEGNLIANNGGDGVLIGSDPAFSLTAAGSGNSVLGNRIFNNAGLGIDLGPNDGLTANDANDADAGPNDLLNTPVLTSAFLIDTSLLITGFINTAPNQVVRIEFFDNVTGGQGQTFLGFINVSMTSNTVVFSTTLTVPLSVLAGHKLTATMTDALGNTSEFSLPLTIE